MARTFALLSLGGLCVALSGCATPGGGQSAEGPATTEVASAPLTLDTPISDVCADPRGRAALDRNLPGLRKNPNYFLFQGFSLRQLASMSGGRITQAKLESVRQEFATAPNARPATH